MADQTLVDSKDELLNIFEIIMIAAENMGSKYSPEVMLPAIMSELNQPNQHATQLGNTFFSVLTGDNRKGFVGAWNADTAKNFVENAKQFCLYAYHDLGLDYVVLSHRNPAIDVLLRVISKNPPQEGMGYIPIKMKNGSTMIVVQLGPKRG